MIISTTMNAPSKVWDELSTGNERFVSGNTINYDVVRLRHQLADEQHPIAIVVTCSDSRVAPEIVFDQPLGCLFVIRGGGNVVDAVAVGTIEFAVQELGCRTLIVMGHDKCAAVAAALSGRQRSSVNMHALLDRILPAVNRVKGGNNEDQLKLAVESNVRQSIDDVLMRSSVVRDLVYQNSFELITCVYRIDSGKVERL